MRVGLMADTHDRLPAIAEFVQQMQAAGVGMVLHAGDYCCAVRARPFEEAQHVARRRVRQERRRHAGAASRGRRRRSAPSCSSRRTASRSAAQRILLVHDIGDVQQRSASRRTSIVVHGFTHQQEMKTRGDTLIVNPGEACGWLYGTPTAAILDLDTQAQVEFLDPARSTVRALDDGTDEPVDVTHPDHRLRLAVHAADRAPGARGARLLGDPSADAHRSSGFASGSRPASSSAADRTRSTRTARRRADPAMFDVAPGARRLLRHAARRAPVGGEVIGARPARVRPRRAQRRRRVRRCSTASQPARRMTVWMSHGDHVDAPPPGYVVTASSASNADRRRCGTTTKPIHCVQFHPEVAHTPRGGEIISNFLFDVCHARAELDAGRVHRGARCAKIRDAGRRRAA